MPRVEVPEEYRGLTYTDEAGNEKPAARWIDRQAKGKYLVRGWLVNEIHGESIGWDDLVLVIKKGCEPKAASKKSKGGDS